MGLVDEKLATHEIKDAHVWLCRGIAFVWQFHPRIFLGFHTSPLQNTAHS
jgi:hypothetical protein